jgi:hypothetical protein
MPVLMPSYAAADLVVLVSNNVGGSANGGTTGNWVKLQITVGSTQGRRRPLPIHFAAFGTAIALGMCNLSAAGCSAST